MVIIAKVDPIRNPFTPGAGSKPPLLVGRDAQLDAMSIAVQRMNLGRFERSLLLTGLRGVGKTVLLNEFGRIAETNGWIHEHIEATDDTRVASDIAAMSRRVLLRLSVRERVKDRARSALGALRTFVKVHVPIGGTEVLIDFEPLPGIADSGSLDADIGGLFREVGETAREGQTGVLFTIDEIQYLTREELGALIVGLHRVSQLGLPLLIAGAGLPSLPGLAGEARSYSERLFTFVEVGSLSEQDARRALVEPVEAEDAEWEDQAVDRLIRQTEGYPYFLQEFGKQAWTVAQSSPITDGDIEAAIGLALDDLDQGFFRARLDKTTDAERDYLRAMANLGGPGPYRSGDVSRAVGRKTTQTGPVRDSLIKRGLCYAPRHGLVAFTVPMFDQYIRRTFYP